VGEAHPDPAATGRPHPPQRDGGDIVTTKGPFAGAREQIAGFAVVDGKNLDEAIEMAARIPAAWHGAIEVRQVQETQRAVSRRRRGSPRGG
jgi:hypothetical protein